jgi:glycosidase
MSAGKRVDLRVHLTGIVFVCCSPLAFAQAPTVTKVEPPNWWVGHTINPVRVLVTGRSLENASVESPKELRTSRLKTSSNGTYLFFDLEIPKKTKPGEYLLSIRTKIGSAPMTFRLNQQLPTKTDFQGFSNDDVIYLVMPDRFANGDAANDDPVASPGLHDRQKSRYYHGGDIQGIIDRLSYLKDLGVTAIWTTPIYDNSNHLNEKETYEGHPIADYHGYGATDYYGVEEHFGTMDTVRKLVNEAHRNGLKVIQDQVENHVGPYHPWVQDEPTPTWFHGTLAEHLRDSPQLWAVADPHASPSLRKPVLEGWFVNILPDLNQEDPEVARYQIQNTLWWLGSAGFDGIRQDTWPYVSRIFWRDWISAIKNQYPHLDVVGEVFHGDPALVSFFQGGKTQYDGIDDMVDSVFDFPLYFKIREAFGQGKPLSVLPEMLAHDNLYPKPERLVTFLGLHDVERFMNEPEASIQNLELAFTCLLTTRGIPMIYYGDEIAMRGGKDPDNRRDFPGGWKGDPRNAFAETGRTPEQNELFTRVRKLLRLRANLESLRYGRTLTLVADDKVWAYARLTKKQITVVVINAGTGPGQARIVLSDLGIPSLSKWTPQLGSAGVPVIKGGIAQATLPPKTAEVYVVDASL